MLCSPPDGFPFKIQVKGISNPSAFYIDKSFFEGPTQGLLFLIVVLVPYVEDNPLRFFILSHAEAQGEFRKMRTHKRDGQPYTSGFGLNWGSVASYEKKWRTLPLSMLASGSPRRAFSDVWSLKFS